MKLALGTVQFGLSYGIANQIGKIGDSEALEILNYARSFEINTLDTAVSYGNSEQRLGCFGVEGFQVISKLPEIPDGCVDIPTWIEKSILASLERLNISKLYGLHIHRPMQLLTASGEEIFSTLTNLKSQGLVDKIGISVYTTDELATLWGAYQFDMVQIPFNVCDRRFETSGWLSRLHKAGVEVHARSVFLQGLLLMNINERPQKFDPWKKLWQEWERWLKQQNITPLQACLSFVYSNPEIDRVLVGVETLKQFQEIIDATMIDNIMVPQLFSSDDEKLLNPVNWL